MAENVQYLNKHDICFIHQNPKTNSMLPERIRLFFTNFPLVSVSQHNADSIASFDTSLLISINTTLSPFYRFL